MNSFQALTQSESNEWYTPQDITQAASDVMDGIALDPATSAMAQEWIRAVTFYTIADDGFSKQWSARSMWLNCPYGQKSKAKGVHGASAWLQKAIDSYLDGLVGECILLCRGDSKPVKWLNANTICCQADRISFICPTDPGKNNPVPGTKIFYLGCRWDLFYQKFSQFGPVVMPYSMGQPCDFGRWLPKKTKHVDAFGLAPQEVAA